MVENGIRYCDYCKQPLGVPLKRRQIKIGPGDPRILQQTLEALQAFAIAFERQPDGSATLDACPECHALLMRSDEGLQEQKVTNLRPFRGSVFQLRKYVRAEDLDLCCGCGAALPQKYEAYVAQSEPQRWVCRDCFEEFRKPLDFELEV
jgi:hypothetical protein